MLKTARVLLVGSQNIPSQEGPTGTSVRPLCLHRPPKSHPVRPWERWAWLSPAVGCTVYNVCHALRQLPNLPGCLYELRAAPFVIQEFSFRLKLWFTAVSSVFVRRVAWYNPGVSTFIFQQQVLGTASGCAQGAARATNILWVLDRNPH